MITNFIGRIYPNGEFGVARKKKLPSEQDASSLPIVPLTENQDWVARQLHLHGHEETIRNNREFGLSPLDSSMLPNSHSAQNPCESKVRLRRGLSGITSYGRKLVRNAAYVLEHENQKKHLSFLTLTLPSISHEESILIGKCFAEIVRLFIQRLSRLLRRNNLPGEIVGCVEIQERRHSDSGILSLHLHLLFVGRKPYGAWVARPETFRTIWQDSCRNECPFLNDRDFSSTENVGSIKKSGEGYLGKYMSKGANLLTTLSEEIKQALPSSWYICSNLLRRRVCSLTLYSSAIGSALMDLIDSAHREGIIYLKPIEIDIPNYRRITVGFYGKVTIAARAILKKASDRHKRDVLIPLHV